jgi:hypothetical protein
LLTQPFAAFHKFLSKIAEVRDRTSERGQAEPEEDQKRLQNRLSKTSRPRFLSASGFIVTVFALLYLTGHGRISCAGDPIFAVRPKRIQIVA